jgi:hypothetical protein
MTKKQGFDAFEDDMHFIFPDLSKQNKKVVIKNYYQLESLVNSAYQHAIPMRLSKIQETPREGLGLSNPKTKKVPRWKKLKKFHRDTVEVDIKGLSAIKAIHPEDKLVVVEAGIQVSELNKQLKPHGLMFPTPLIYNKTIMEVINENLLLSNSYKRGAVRNHIEDIILMTPASKLIKTGNLTGDDF